MELLIEDQEIRATHAAGRLPPPEPGQEPTARLDRIHVKPALRKLLARFAYRLGRLDLRKYTSRRIRHATNKLHHLAQCTTAVPGSETSPLHSVCSLLSHE